MSPGIRSRTPSITRRNTSGPLMSFGSNPSPQPFPSFWNDPTTNASRGMPSAARASHPVDGRPHPEHRQLDRQRDTVDLRPIHAGQRHHLFHLGVADLHPADARMPERQPLEHVVELRIAGARCAMEVGEGQTVVPVAFDRLEHRVPADEEDASVSVSMSTSATTSGLDAKPGCDRMHGTGLFRQDPGGVVADKVEPRVWHVGMELVLSWSLHGRIIPSAGAASSPIKRRTMASAQVSSRVPWMSLTGMPDVIGTP